MKKDYLQPIIEIEYYLDVILCAQDDTYSSPWGDAGEYPSESENPGVAPRPQSP